MYKYKLKKGQNYFNNEGYFTNSKFVIKSNLIVTNKEDVNLLLKNNKNFKYNSNTGINKDCKIPKIDYIMHDIYNIDKKNSDNICKLQDTSLLYENIFTKELYKIFYNNVTKKYIYIKNSEYMLFANLKYINISLYQYLDNITIRIYNNNNDDLIGCLLDNKCNNKFLE